MTHQEYTPYGEEWKKEMANMPKKVIIDIAANIGASKHEHASPVVDMCVEAAESHLKSIGQQDPLLLGAILGVKDMF